MMRGGKASKRHIALLAPASGAGGAQQGEMKRIETSIIVGMVLIGAGVLFLLQNLGVLGPVGNVVRALLFVVGGGAFLMAFAIKPGHWWALIPGFALLGLGALL